jgi:uncharacterized phiE125 gp8 family phage protein
MALTLTKPPETEPVVLKQAKDQLRIADTDTDQDDLILAKVRAAREFVEIRTRRSLITQRWLVTLDGFPCSGVIRLPRPPLLQVLSVKYIDAYGALLSLVKDVDFAVVNRGTEPSELVPGYELSWPPSRDVPNAVQVEIETGYGGADAVPGELVDAILLRLQHLFDGDEAATAAALKSMEPYRVWEFAR